MRFEELPVALQEWLRTMCDTGSATDAVVQTLVAAKYDPTYANDAVAAAWRALRGDGDPRAADASREGSVATSPAAGSASEGEQQAGRPAALSSQLAQMPSSLPAFDRTVEMLFVIAAPRVVLFGNLLSDEECDQLISLSRDRVQRSSVVNASTGAYDIHPHRTSAGTYFRRGENELLQRIEHRIAELVDCPVEHGEPIQVLHYEPGGEYRPHYDYFDPAHSGNRDVLSQGGQRIATLIMYLNDVALGGSTVFPEIGLDVLPRRGHAVYFAYCDDDGALDTRTLHGGSPVYEGEKWIATKWFRQRAYGGPGA
ncbi:MAG: 2OG-Fe(II) oxygenase [Burkholderiaceae bacterium]